MDTKLFNIAFSHMLGTVAWDVHGEHEFVLVGDGITIDCARLQALIDATFQDSPLCCSLDRRTAFTIPRSGAAAEIAKRIGPNQGITVADSNLHMFLQVNPIGVAHTGVAQANNSFKPKPLRGSA